MYLNTMKFPIIIWSFPHFYHHCFLNHSVFCSSFCISTSGLLSSALGSIVGISQSPSSFGGSGTVGASPSFGASGDFGFGGGKLNMPSVSFLRLLIVPMI